MAMLDQGLYRTARVHAPTSGLAVYESRSDEPSPTIAAWSGAHGRHVRGRRT